jgi:hypothetical protein
MVAGEQLCKIVEDLIDVMHLQAKQLENLVVHVEQIAGRVPGDNQLSLIVSELSELKRRIQGQDSTP